jgi:hypothetical protein
LDPPGFPLPLRRFGKSKRRNGGYDRQGQTRDVRQPQRKTYRHDGAPLLTTVELDDVEEAPDARPLRRGTIGYPGFSGYSPAGVFDRRRRRRGHSTPFPLPPEPEMKR